MNNNLSDKDLINKIQDIWSKNKKSEELVKYFEILINQEGDIDVDLYLIYLNTLVNLGKINKALTAIENEDNIKNAKEIVAFKIKLLFFLKKYSECEAYIKSAKLQGDNIALAERTLKQLKEKLPKTEKIQEVKPKIKQEEKKEKEVVIPEVSVEIPKKIKEKEIIKEPVKKEEVKIEEVKKEEVKTEVIKEKIEKDLVKDEEVSKNLNKKSKIKFIVPLIAIGIVLLVGGIYLSKKSTGTDIAIKTFINLEDNGNLSKYKSSKSNVDYKLPVDMEFEFVSSLEDSNEKEDLYVTYKVTDENIATITEDGFFKGKKAGTVDIQTINKNKVIDTITIEVLNEGTTKEEADTSDSSHEWKIQEFIQSYEKDYIKAVNEGNYNLIKKYLVKGGPLDKEHSTNIKKFYDDGIKERLDSLQFMSVDKLSEGEYLANVKETIAIIKNGEEKVKEFDSFYNVIVQDNGTYLISEMLIRSTNEISNNTSETSNINYSDKEKATERAKEIAKSAGVNFLNGEDTMIDHDGRRCWEFYIGVGESRVEILYIDAQTGEFKESINSSLDWRYEW